MLAIANFSKLKTIIEDQIAVSDEGIAVAINLLQT